MDQEETESWSELSAQELITKKDSIEVEIKAQNEILEGVSQSCRLCCLAIAVG